MKKLEDYGNNLLKNIKYYINLYFYISYKYYSWMSLNIYLYNICFINNSALFLFISFSFSKVLIKLSLNSKYSIISFCFSIVGIGILKSSNICFVIFGIHKPVLSLSNNSLFIVI